ncbi:hypothetical protein CH298_04310 [Rhodococcoides fascians]|uniref:hypothetical protein n=1 Tax=Rhodococcoides fascians TaxID=1828 RepID=UPI000B9B00E5|nr:hypothetical protein [Rhodococcus fascians]OZE92729.1 hypothetical protein CH303_04305 [Rhodococcus fascians]OZF23362.1 hypothetical protein CH298_04310 [Rhodococcus fascians]OZF25075.1 hypothetical protein CH297_04305 [Rhodococcus fascians]OZF72671.1 hypothetical protein CH308_04310 [Rhodococcus fascians]OZF73970.1 hypothetical protein CH307_04310 [Rhodococcus fascians]
MNERAVLAAARLLSTLCGLGAIAVGILYAGPEALVRRPLPAGQETLVVLIESAFPVWPFLFGLTGVALVICAWWRSSILVAHGFVVFAWSFWGFCLIIAPLRSVPPTPIMVGVIAFVSCVAANVGTMRLWAALGVK